MEKLRLSWELEHLAHRENEFKEIYLVLSNQCKKYSCDLLDLCRSTEEVIAVLNRRNESEYEEDEQNGEEDKLTLSRLKMALKYEQKQSLGVRSGLYGGWCQSSQPRVAIWFCIAVAECGFTLSSNNRTPDLRSPGHFFRTPLPYRGQPLPNGVSVSGLLTCCFVVRP
ncbi:transient-receptor-potential-like protein [Trichonephila clavipes]|nr:transient-receptor-potential-like protein [Trichonephila clavipes]